MPRTNGVRSPVLDFLGVGNAIADVFVRADNEAVAALGQPRGSMRLVSPEESLSVIERLSAAGTHLDPAPGGSVANTTMALAQMGASTGFLGSFAPDAIGKLVVEEMTAHGVECPCPFGPSARSMSTGVCVVAVSPDAERTMNTCLGASASFSPAMVPPDVVDSARIVMLEGYLWDVPGGPVLMEGLATKCRAASKTVVLTLSDALCVGRHRDSLIRTMADSADVVFASRSELEAACGTAGGSLESTLRVAERLLSGGISRGGYICTTLSSEGAVVSTARGRVSIPVAPVTKVVDSTGAGDLFAAGMLYGLSRGWDAARSGRLASAAAAEVVSHIGVRPTVSLRTMAESLVHA